MRVTPHFLATLGLAAHVLFAAPRGHRTAGRDAPSDACTIGRPVVTLLKHNLRRVSWTVLFPIPEHAATHAAWTRAADAVVDCNDEDGKAKREESHHARVLRDRFLEFW